MDWRTPKVIWWLPLFGVASALTYCFTTRPFSHAFMRLFGLILLIAGASFVVGALLGFLFGIPRALRMDDVTADAQVKKGQRYAGNSNLEQISDWLTKILIGAGLVDLGNLISHIGDLSRALGAALAIGMANRSQATASTVALALILFFFISGFLVVYMYTRVDFGPLMARTEDEYAPPAPPEPPELPSPPPPTSEETAPGSSNALAASEKTAPTGRTGGPEGTNMPTPGDAGDS